MFGIDTFATCNLCAGPVRRDKRDVWCGRCGAEAHEPGPYGPVVLMRRTSNAPATETADNYGGTD